MPLATEQGKEAAIAALHRRREMSKTTNRINNADLPAGSPMYFYCESCGFTITVPESYVTRHTKCEQCRAMERMGWPLD